MSNGLLILTVFLFLAAIAKLLENGVPRRNATSCIICMDKSLKLIRIGDYYHVRVPPGSPECNHSAPKMTIFCVRGYFKLEPKNNAGRREFWTNRDSLIKVLHFDMTIPEHDADASIFLVIFSVFASVFFLTVGAIFALDTRRLLIKKKKVLRFGTQATQVI